MTILPCPVILFVSWVDSSVQHGWLADIHHAPLKCQTVGFLVEENDEHLVLALSRGVDENALPWAECISIPVCAITARTKLAGPPEPAPSSQPPAHDSAP